jgi:CreA protein
LHFARRRCRPFAQEPDRIFDKSTVWRPLTPNDKLAVYGLDDPLVEGVACHYTTPEKGGIKGTMGLAEEVSDISLACRQIGPCGSRRSSSRATSCSRSAAR